MNKTAEYGHGFRARAMNPKTGGVRLTIECPEGEAEEAVINELLSILESMTRPARPILPVKRGRFEPRFPLVTLDTSHRGERGGFQITEFPHGGPLLETFGRTRFDLRAGNRAALLLNTYANVSDTLLDALPHPDDMNEAYQMLRGAVARVLELFIEPPFADAEGRYVPPFPDEPARAQIEELRAVYAEAVALYPAMPPDSEKPPRGFEKGQTTD